MEKDYITWQEYYKNTFSNQYDLLNKKRESILINQNQILTNKIITDFCIDTVNLFRSACELMKLYLHNNGLFQFSKREIIKEMYYIGALSNGDEWMEWLNLYENIITYNREKLQAKILDFSKEYHHIFNKLNIEFMERMCCD